MRYVFDTNILVHYIRESPIMVQVEENFQPFAEGNQTWLSAVSIGEIRSFAMQSKWGQNRIYRLENLLQKLLIQKSTLKNSTTATPK